MKYLIDLKNDLLAHFDELTGDKTYLQIVNGNMPSNTQTVSYIARFVLVDCRLAEPFAVLAFIRQWFETRGRTIPDLNFDCDVIDLESYDLQIDIGLNDKLTFTPDGVNVCPELVWSDTAGTFISSAILAGDLVDDLTGSQP